MSRNNGGIRDATIERARTDRMTAMHSCEDRNKWQAAIQMVCAIDSIYPGPAARTLKNNLSPNFGG